MALRTRIERLAQEFQQEIARIIHQEVKDPRLGFVTVTRVALSSDLRHAKVLFSCLGQEAERAQSQAALDHAAGFIRGLIKKRFRLKVIPEIIFRYDESIVGTITLSEMLDRLHEPRPPAP
jgi:ribosome-binding factor A